MNMAGDTSITVVGNLTADPELRFTQSGLPVANFTVASTPRAYNRQTEQWEDQETLFMRCSVWRDAAQNLAGSLHKGNRVMVIGRLKSRTYQTAEGENRTVMELEADEVAASVRYAVVTIQKVQRDHAPAASEPAGDPWSSSTGDDTPF